MCVVRKKKSDEGHVDGKYFYVCRPGGRLQISLGDDQLGGTLYTYSKWLPTAVWSQRLQYQGKIIPSVLYDYESSTERNFRDIYRINYVIYEEESNM